jgi:hypothetical protein
VDSSAEKFSLFFMYFDHHVFGYDEFIMVDTTLFTAYPKSQFASTRKIGIKEGTRDIHGRGMSMYQICFDLYYCGTPDEPECTGGCDYQNCPTNQCFWWGENCIPINDGGGGGIGDGPWSNPGEGDIGGGGSGGGSYDPPPCPGGSGRFLIINPCGGGWIPVVPEEPPAPLPILTGVDMSEINDPCLISVISAISNPGHHSFILRTYFQQQYTPNTAHKYQIKYQTNNNLLGNNGQPVPGNTQVNLLSDGTNEVVITLNPSFFQYTSKEWVTAVILHEMAHGILIVNRPDLSTQYLQHTNMFDNKAPLTIWQSLHEIFPGLSEHDGIALGMDGLSEAYMIDDPSNPGGPQIIDPIKDQFAQTVYGQNINQAVTTAANYMNGNLGTLYC